jgi:hypothetical protein
LKKAKTFFISALLLLLIVPAPSFAQEKRGVIEGKVINRTIERPISGLKVSLDILRGGQKFEAKETVSDEKGNFKFEGLPVGEEYDFIVYTQFEGASYDSRAKLTSKASHTKLTLEVYNSSTDPSKVVITEYYIQVETSRTVKVTEFLNIANEGKTSYAVDNTNKEKPLGLVLTLPEGFQNLQMIEGLMQCCSRVEGNRILSQMSIPPGTNRIVFSYELSGAKANLSKEVPFNTRNFYLIVANPKVKVGTSKLAFRGLQQHEETPFQLYWAGNLKRGESVDILLSNLPSRGRFFSLVIILAVVIAAAVFFFLFFWQRREEEREEVEEEVEEDIEPAGESESLKRVYLEFVVVLDKLYEEGEIPKKLYKKLRKEYKSKLARLLEEE